ncbi:MAG: ParB/RepB/Spo0J family partition protein [Tannerella sp.]|jgi:ParB family chromosome partitioning protein|nr:ParB/RepB/Spo0J family partition protein [Tannerella sp.]
MKQKNSNKKQTGKEKTQETPVTAEMKQASPEVIQNIELSMIVCSPFNPRKYRNEEELEELTQSIVNFGIIQPVTLRVKGETYEIVCGERRYRSSLKAGTSTIPAIVKNYSDEEAMEITILENLQRRDINPVEEALSFGKLMEVRGYFIEDLVKQFGKTDKYIRSRLQLRNLVDEVAELLVEEEITLGIALELARFCPDIQKNVYREHLSADDSYSWKRLQTKDFRKMIEKGYSADLSNYEFDKSDCIGCRSNSSICDLFADGNCGLCQNMECLRYKQAEYMAAEATKLLKERKNAAICVAPESFASAEVVNNLVDTGHEIYEMSASRLPSEPEKPVAENYASETEYLEAEKSYQISFERYNIHAAQIEAMVEQGKAQLLVDVSKRKPELCYRVIPETGTEPQNEDTIEKLRSQDRRNRELAFEKGIEEVTRYLRNNAVPTKAFSPREQELLYFIMLSFLRKKNYKKFGMEGKNTLSDEEKAEMIQYISIEQENAIRRDFIIHYLSQTSGNSLKSGLLLEFATMHFPDKVAQIKEQCNETYKKKHERIEERIRELQPFTDKEKANAAIAEAIVVNEEQMENLPANPEPFDDPDMDDVPLYPELPEHARIGEIPKEEEEIAEVVTVNGEQPADPETLDNPDMDDIPLYPGLPEHASIGEIPEEEEEAFDTVYEEMAA